MLTKDIYNELVNRPNSNVLLNSFLDLKNKARNEGNLEYVYLCSIRICDIYLDLADNVKALSILAPIVNEIDKKKYKDIYASVLERLIYLYIQKGSFALAYKYTYEKREYIDDANPLSMSRWYLEMAYVYTKQDEIQNAINCYEAILNLNTSETDISFALSNLTRIYIEQNMIGEAKKLFKECVAHTLDEEGKEYNKYLQAKIYISDGDNLNAFKLFDELLSGEIRSEYLSIANEYLEILIKSHEFSKALDLIERMEAGIEECPDLDLKNEFYNNKLKVYAIKYNDDKVMRLINDINTVQSQIIERNKETDIEAYSDEKATEIAKSLSLIVDKVEKINDIDFSLCSNEREFLIEYLSRLELIIGFNRFYIIQMDEENILPFNEVSDSLLKVYDYSNKRLYERSININNIGKTCIEDVLLNNSVQYYDLSVQGTNLIDFIKGESYASIGMGGHLVALPISKENKLKFVCVAYAKFYDFASLENSIVTFVSATRLIDAFINIKNHEKINYLLNANTLMEKNGLSLIHYKTKVYLNNNLANLLGFDSSNDYLDIDINSFASLINDYSGDYKQELANNNALAKTFSYKLKINDKFTPVKEEAVLIEYASDYFYYSVLSLASYENTSSKKDITLSGMLEQIKVEKGLRYTILFTKRVSDEYGLLKLASESFGVTPIKDKENYFIFIKDDINLRTIDKLLDGSNNFYSIVKYPKDISDLESLSSLLNYMFDNSVAHFSLDFYAQYLKSIELKNALTKNLNDSNIDYQLLSDGSYLISLNARGISISFIRGMLDLESLVKYDDKVLSMLVDTGIDEYIVYSNSKSVARLLKSNQVYPNIKFVIDNYDKDDLITLINLAKGGFNLYLDFNCLKQIDAYSIDLLKIGGLSVKDASLYEDAYNYARVHNIALIALENTESNECIHLGANK